MKTVGVAPGSFTIQLNAPCPPDPVGGATGVPEIGWYDSINNPQTTNSLVWENPYGTESTLKGAGADVGPGFIAVGLVTLGIFGLAGYLLVKSYRHLGRPRRRR